jgi:hypothetical protein
MRYGFSAAVVLHLVQRLKEVGHMIYFDNFFSTFNLFEILNQKQLNAISTVRMNRFRNNSHLTDKEMKTKGR